MASEMSNQIHFPIDIQTCYRILFISDRLIGRDDMVGTKLETDH